MFWFRATRSGTNLFFEETETAASGKDGGESKTLPSQCTQGRGTMDEKNHPAEPGEAKIHLEAYQVYRSSKDERWQETRWEGN